MVQREKPRGCRARGCGHAVKGRSMSTLPRTTDTQAGPDAWATARQAADDLRVLLARLGADRALVAAVSVWHDLARTTVCVHIPALPPEVARRLAALRPAS